MTKKNITRRLIAMMLAFCVLAALALPVFAAVNDGTNSIEDSGSKTAKVKQVYRDTILTHSLGAALGGMYWEYTTDKGVSGPAYCINWGLSSPDPEKYMTIKGRSMTLDAKVQGAFASGYPQVPLSEFVQGNTQLSGLTESEYGYATQVSIWASLGQIGIEGTGFTAGRATVGIPKNNAQEIRVYNAIKVILNNADKWTVPQYRGMYTRYAEDEHGRGLHIVNQLGLEGAAAQNQDGLAKETINGTEYYTRKVILSSATPSKPMDWHIGISLRNAPTGTVFADMSNTVLPTQSLFGATMFIADAGKSRATGLNANGIEYYAEVKLCIPAQGIADSGLVEFGITSIVTQYELYMVENPVSSEQSYIVADPSENRVYSDGTFSWESEEMDYGQIEVTKADGVGNDLPGAEFVLKTLDNQTIQPSSSTGSKFVFSMLAIGKTYTLHETKSPDGYKAIAPRSITVGSSVTIFETVRNTTQPTFTVKKTDRQNGYSLQGVVMRLEQIDGSFTTEAVTGHDGTITFTGDDLPFGSYRVFEKTALDGYNLDSTPQTVHWDGTADVALYFSNVRKPSLQIAKVSDLGHPLSGAVFKVYKDGAHIATVMSDDAGIATVPGITSGYFEVEETQAPLGFIAAPGRVGIHIDPYDPATSADPVLAVVNAAKPYLRVLKYDIQTMKPIPSTTFEIYRDTALVGTYTTDANGEIYIQVEPGIFLVKESAPAPGHVLNPTPQELKVEAGSGKSHQLIFLNYVKPGIHLVKLDSQSMLPLPNARYLISEIGGVYSREYTTNQQGEIDLTGLDPAAYEVRELAAPDGWIADDAVRTIRIDPGMTAAFVFTNTKKPTLEIVKFDGEHFVPGATFRVAKIEDGTHYLDRITDLSGKVLLELLEPGVYSVQELAAPDTHVLNSTEYHVELFPGQTSTLVVNNEKKPNLRIFKTDAISGAPVMGAAYTVRKVDSSTLTTVTTGVDGSVLIEKLEPGVYEIIEKSCPDMYILNSTPQLITLESGRTGEARFQNYPKPGLEVLKVTPDSNPLPGVTFTLAEKNGQEIGAFTTGPDGKLFVPFLKVGYYILTERSVPAHIILDPTPIEVYLDSDKTITSITVENHVKPELLIYKKNAITKDNIEGAAFTVWQLMTGDQYRKVGEYTSDTQGEIRLPRLDEGWYRIEETASAPGYAMPEVATKDVYLKPDEVKTVTFENTPLSSIIVRKVDAVSGAVIPETLIRIRYLAGTSGTGGTGGTVIFEGRTSVNGTVTVTGLAAGTYIVEEVTPNPNYEMTGETTKAVYISGDEQAAVTVELTNYKKGGLIIRKLETGTNKPLVGAQFFVTDSSGAVIGNSNGLYTTDADGLILIDEPLTSGTTVVAREEKPPVGYILDAEPQSIKIRAGETHTLTFYNTASGGVSVLKLDEDSRQPIKSVEFSITRLDGGLVGTYRTDVNGQFFVGLEAGAYFLLEKSAPKPYTVNTEPLAFEVKDGAVTALEVTNRKQASILIHKVDSVSNKGIPGVSFLLYDSGNNPIRQYVSDQSGYVWIDGELAPGKYLLRELESASGYLLDEQPKTVSVEGGRTTEIRWENTPIMAQIQVIKRSGDDNPRNGLEKGTLLPGAVFEVLDKAGNVMDTMTSGADGRAISRPLPLGWYTLREVQPPANYKPSDETFIADLEHAGQIVRLEVLNYSVALSVAIQKKGPLEVIPGQQMSYTISGIANTSTVPLQSFYWRDTLPINAVRLSKLTTGTYNQALSYKIVYKTNTADEYRVLADNLNTQRSYTLDCSAAALRLRGNEAVTEVMLVFGSVKAGFAQVESPRIVCDVLPGLANGLRFVNEADVGGLYGGQWIMGNARWVTVIWSKYPKPTLPKSGY